MRFHSIGIRKLKNGWVGETTIENVTVVKTVFESKKFKTRDAAQKWYDEATKSRCGK